MPADEVRESQRRLKIELDGGDRRHARNRATFLKLKAERRPASAPVKVAEPNTSKRDTSK